ncbi:MAG: hypothetical protein RLZZ53_2901 [Acidobacteriota bacterium]
MSDKTDQERALAYLRIRLSDAEIDLDDAHDAVRDIELRISVIENDIGRVQYRNDPQALADILREMERHK